MSEVPLQRVSSSLSSSEIAVTLSANHAPYTSNPRSRGGGGTTHPFTLTEPSTLNPGDVGAIGWDIEASCPVSASIKHLPGAGGEAGNSPDGNVIKRYGLNPHPSTLNPQPSTHNPQPSTLNPRPSTVNPKPETRNQNPKPETRNPGGEAADSPGKVIKRNGETVARPDAQVARRGI